MTTVNLDSECAKEALGAELPPFDVYLFKDLLELNLFEQLQRDVARVKCDPKNNDLYKFHQSKDLLSQMDSRELPQGILNFSKLMLDKVKPHLEKLCQLKLSRDTFDITASHYGRGDYLLCHNDDIKDSSRKHARALAFVYYLNKEPFARDDGGALILYKSDEKGEPIEESHRLSPQPNSLVVFRTSPVSWHCVEEVGQRDDRLSVNGWFHLEEPPAPEVNREVQSQAAEACPYNFVKPTPLDERLEKFFKECINGEYLMEKTCYLVRRKFKKASEINLTDFLVKEKYQEICAELKKAASDNEEPRLQVVGPYNKRHYHRMPLDRLPQICRDLYDAFRSELFFILLSRFTGLDLHPPSLVDQDDKVPGDSSDEDPEDMEDDDDDDDDDDDEDDDGATGDEDEEDEEEEGEVGEEEEVEAEDGGKDAAESQDVGVEADSLKRKHEADSNNPNRPTAKEREAKPTKRKRVSDPLARLEFRHLDAGAYTLVHDFAYETAEKSALDVILHFNHDFEVNLKDGGYIAYLDGSNDDDLEPEDRELLTVEPKSNSLSLVYREEGTCRFLKYLNKSHKAAYQDLSCVYYEKPDDLPAGRLSSNDDVGQKSVGS